MALRATSLGAADAYDRIRQQASDSRTYLQRQRAVLVAEPVDAAQGIAVVLHFAAIIPRLQAFAATPGLAQYARDQANDQAYDVVAEFNTMLAAMVAARDQLISMFPKDGSAFLLYQKFNADGSIANRTFTAAQLAPAVSLIDGVLATIV